MPPVLNIAAYAFTPLPPAELPSLRQDLRHRALSLGLLGTILLAPEGINLFLAGPPADVDAFLAHLRTLPGLAGLAEKRSFSARPPFGKLAVKLKRQIIPFSHPRPSPDPTRRVSPGELKSWLDDRRPVVLLDTRNDYETALGTFDRALTFPLNDFRRLPDHLHASPDLARLAKDTPIVTFCTGGIRCEKAAPYLASLGFTNVYQLEGGILAWFEHVGPAHYTGTCFVFDQRVALTPDLKPLPTTGC